MSIRSHRNSKASRRRGAAFLLLVAMVLLVIVTATQWLIRGSVVNRRGEARQIRQRSLAAAIDFARQLPDLAEPLRLQVSENTDERIEVARTDDGSMLTATWYRGETEISKLVRPTSSTAPPLITKN